MARESPHRLLDHLPAIYRGGDGDSDLVRLLRAFEELLFVGPSEAPSRLPGIEHLVGVLPAVFAPLGPGELPGPGGPGTPDRFLPWLATWLAFAPHALVEPQRLRHVVAGIVPMYGRRGTRAFLERLLALCFDEIAAVRVDEQLAGLRVGSSTLGVDSLLAQDRPFWFRVDVDVRPGTSAPVGPVASKRFKQRLCAIIDFAKPAHTAYELRVRHAHATPSAASRTRGREAT